MPSKDRQPKRDHFYASEIKKRDLEPTCYGQKKTRWGNVKELTASAVLEMVLGNLDTAESIARERFAKNPNDPHAGEVIASAIALRSAIQANPAAAALVAQAQRLETNFTELVYGPHAASH
jgi:hypothetical protein